MIQAFAYDISRDPVSLLKEELLHTDVKCELDSIQAIPDIEIIPSNLIPSIPNQSINFFIQNQPLKKLLADQAPSHINTDPDFAPFIVNYNSD